MSPKTKMESPKCTTYEYGNLKDAPARQEGANSPGPLDATLIGFKPDAPVCRVHPSNRAPAEFNSSTVGSARFSPLLDPASGQVIPTLYAGVTFDCAFMETVFHDVPYAPGLKFVRKRDRLADRVVSRIAILSELTLVDLSAIALRRLGIARKHLLETEKAEFPVSREWAQALYLQFPEAQGLLWTSRQDDKAQSFMLFAPRIAPGSLVATGDPEPLLQPDGSARREILDLARRLNVAVVD